MYDLDCRDALSGIAKIRNIFAHRLGHVDSLSADPDLTKGFQYLTLHKKYTHYPAINELQGEGIKIAAPINEGDIFIVNFRILRMILLNDKFYHRNRSNDRATPQEMIDYFDQEYGRGTWLRKYGAESPLDQ